MSFVAQGAEEILTRLNLDDLAGSSLLVTGASGLIGVNLLGSLGYWARSRSRTISVAAVAREPLPGYLEPFFENVRVHYGDLTDHAFIRSLGSYDHVIHAAGYAQPGRFMAKPIKTIEINTTATAELLDRLAARGRFLFVSSSEIYSGSHRIPHREEDIGTTGPDHPRACYIEGKRCGEAICNAARKDGIAAMSARVSLAYGPGARRGDQRVMSALIRKGLVERRVTLADAGQARRTYGYVSDIVEMLLQVLQRGDEAVYNVGGTSSLTILELAQAIGRILDVPVVVPEVSEGSSGAPAEVAVDLTRVTKAFGKTSFLPFEDGLRRTIGWHHAIGEA